LTLLVTELQNQDPTANTDPNEYINQLVEVNSLEQLISINQTLSSALGTSTSSSSSKDVSATEGASALTQMGTQASHPATASAVTEGNLNLPAVNSAAERVAHALDGHTQSSTSTPSLSGAQ
jgi:flagellar basal-body rod modification protein FlgD